ncbi:hypothetical protein CEXT_215821 [Caerostris extrusa]|uniref:Uncharacterized protein n=1 Tax=Caerostris extrusa TaxID=172846 RepID=A0AAV4QFG4_CAEEX|nr:hypothetical protein CEXT_215821 [Caerostris extrusa]
MILSVGTGLNSLRLTFLSLFSDIDVARKYNYYALRPARGRSKQNDLITTRQPRSSTSVTQASTVHLSWSIARKESPTLGSGSRTPFIKEKTKVTKITEDAIQNTGIIYRDDTGHKRCKNTKI